MKPGDCDSLFPDLVLCDTLGSAYRFASPHEACRAILGRHARAVHPVPSYNGPCVGAGGWHWRCDIRGKFGGAAASCCPCCEEDNAGAVKRRLCRNH